MSLKARAAGGGSLGSELQGSPLPTSCRRAASGLKKRRGVGPTDADVALVVVYDPEEGSDGVGSVSCPLNGLKRHVPSSASSLLTEWLESWSAELFRISERRRSVKSLKSTMRERIGRLTVCRGGLKPDKPEPDERLPLSQLLRWCNPVKGGETGRGLVTLSRSTSGVVAELLSPAPGLGIENDIVGINAL